LKEDTLTKIATDAEYEYSRLNSTVQCMVKT